jgi:serine/threonine-protein kinase RsbW
MPLPKTTHIVIRNKIADLAALTTAMERIGAEYGMPENSLIKLQVALDEVVSNVIKYAWPEAGAHDIEIRITARDDSVEVEIIDDGRMFDPRGAPKRDKPPSGQKPQPGGVGVQMTKQLVDGIGYARIGNRNHTTLTKLCVLSPTALRMQDGHVGPVCVLSLSGRIDSGNAEDLLDRLNGLLSSGEQTILLDFKEVLYLTSAAFRVLLVATDKAQRNTARVVLCGLAGQVRELFERGGLLEAFTVHGSREDALAKL